MTLKEIYDQFDAMGIPATYMQKERAKKVVRECRRHGLDLCTTLHDYWFDSLKDTILVRHCGGVTLRPDITSFLDDARFSCASITNNAIDEVLIADGYCVLGSEPVNPNDASPEDYLMAEVKAAERLRNRIISQGNK